MESTLKNKKRRQREEENDHNPEGDVEMALHDQETTSVESG
jgi:hypothetical protein